MLLKFSKFQPKEKECFGPNNLELKSLYPLTSVKQCIFSESKRKLKRVGILTVGQQDPKWASIVGRLECCQQPSYQSVLAAKKPPKNIKRPYTFIEKMKLL